MLFELILKQKGVLKMKSRILKAGLLFTLVVFAVFSLGSAFAQPPIYKPKPPISNPNVLRGQADLSITGIGVKHWGNGVGCSVGGGCSSCCDTLSSVGAAYLNDLTVEVTCYPRNYPGNLKKTNGTVEVTYYDLVQGRTVIKSKHFVNLTCQRQVWLHFTVVNHPLLIKIGRGIKATVTPDGPVDDPNPGNNRKIVRKARHIGCM